jgi:hypothetical protein
MQKSESNSASNSVKSPRLYFFPDREQIGVNTHPSAFKKSMATVSNPDIDPPGLAALNQITNRIGILRELEAEREVVERSHGNNSERNISAHERCGDLSHRSITAGDDNKVDIFLGDLSRSRGEIQVSLDDDLQDRVADRFEALMNPAAQLWIG